MNNCITLHFLALIVALAIMPNVRADQTPKYDQKTLDRLEQLRQNKSKPTNYATLSAEDVLKKALGQIPREPQLEKLIAEQIQGRPEEFKAAILRKLDADKFPVEHLFHIPYWAKYVGNGFEVEAAKRALFHPMTTDCDPQLFNSPGFCDYFDSDETVKKEVIDQLVELGRLEQGSKAHQWWSMSAAERKVALNSGTGPGNASKQPIEDDQSESSEMPNPGPISPLIISGIVGLVLVAFLFFTWMQKSSNKVN